MAEQVAMHKFDTAILIGCGGIGSHFLPPFVRFLSSMEPASRPTVVKLVDGDKYAASNNNRQEFVPKHLGVNKAESQLVKMSAYYAGVTQFVAVPEYVGKDNVANIITENSIVFMGVDNHVCRRIVSAHCQNVCNVVLITGGNELTDGNVQIYVRVEGKDLTPPIEKRHPEILTTNDGDRTTMSCEELEKLPSGGQVIFANQMASTLMCQMFWNICHNRFPFNEIYFDVNVMKTRGVENEQESQG